VSPGQPHSTWLMNITNDLTFDVGLNEARDAAQKFRTNLPGDCWFTQCKALIAAHVDVG